MLVVEVTWGTRAARPAEVVVDPVEVEDNVLDVTSAMAIRPATPVAVLTAEELERLTETEVLYTCSR